MQFYHCVHVNIELSENSEYDQRTMDLLPVLFSSILLAFSSLNGRYQLFYSHFLPPPPNPNLNHFEIISTITVLIIYTCKGLL